MNVFIFHYFNRARLHETRLTDHPGQLANKSSLYEPGLPATRSELIQLGLVALRGVFFQPWPASDFSFYEYIGRNPDD